MPTGEKPTETDLNVLLEELLDAGIKFILVGGLAAVVQGAPVTTMDVDIVHEQSPENILKILDFIKSVNGFHRRPDDKLIEPRAGDISGTGHVLLKTSLGPMDVLAVIEEGRNYNDLLKHTVDIEFRGRTLRVLDLEMLVELKRASKDLKDKLRLPILEEVLCQIKEKEG